MDHALGYCYVLDEKEKHLHHSAAGYGRQLDYFACCNADSFWYPVFVCLCDRPSDTVAVSVADTRTDESWSEIKMILLQPCV